MARPLQLSFLTSAAEHTQLPESEIEIACKDGLLVADIKD